MKTPRFMMPVATTLAALMLAACAQNAPVTAPSAATTPVSAQAKSVPGDAAIPIAELMPLTMRYEADLKLTPEQVKALTDYRNANMPKRVAGQKQLLAQRGNLRAAMLAGQPTAELMRQVQQTELEHMQARERCVQFMRQTLTAPQYAQLTQRYLDGLR
ncbi:Spy/CpxP family protein refolding chaperone [Ottowia testudinis]|uniref:Spy/CpxP family protein refolding chaperone n=1 Tax=Ottowia testudinis TaxID=2816950 RepID=A0A975CKH8_9BURK|nr:Spy/CpxP family protein refolding chaperone [Ottowia testudinis]QTD45133.1 Spy/CpxP family protein refolding chaperone [Ottowia testudinis]